MNYPTTYRALQIDSLSIFYREAGRRMRRRFSCCTDFRHRRGCSNRFSRGYPTATI